MSRTKSFIALNAMYLDMGVTSKNSQHNNIFEKISTTDIIALNTRTLTFIANKKVFFET